MNRRNFLMSAGTVALTVTALPKIAGAAAPADAGNPSVVRPDGLVTRSTGYFFFNHSHELVIPMDLLKNPPAAGVTLSTGKAAFHSHSVELTREHLADIATGKAVSVLDATIGEHSFLIQLRGGLSIRGI